MTKTKIILIFLMLIFISVIAFLRSNYLYTPIVDDPYIFGQIAATNALNDVYAMGGKPLTAMNIVCFPIKKMDIGILRECYAVVWIKCAKRGFCLSADTALKITK